MLMSVWLLMIREERQAVGAVLTASSERRRVPGALLLMIRKERQAAGARLAPALPLLPVFLPPSSSRDRA